MRVLSLVSLLILSSCFVGEELPPDQDVWEYAQPSEVGVSEGDLLVVDNAIQFQFIELIRSMIIIKDDQLIFENYYRGDERVSIHSVGQTSVIVTLLGFGILIDERRINDLDTTIENFLPEYEDIFFANPQKADITLRHLLTHSSGFAWNENTVPFFNPDNDLNRIRSEQDWIRYILERPLEAPPGARVNVNSATGIIIARIIEDITGQPFEDFIQERVFDIVGIENWFWEQDPQSNANGGFGLSLSNIDLTRIGYLYINEGLWDGRRVVSRDWIQESTSLQREISNNINYGFYWNVFSDNFNGIALFDPNDTYFIPQHLYISQGQNLVVSFSTIDVLFGTFSDPFTIYNEVAQSITNGR